jgi:hypothetical protein
VLLNESFPKAMGICFPRKWSFGKWGNIFLGCGEMSSWGTLPIIEYVSWRNVILGNYLYEEPFPQYVPSEIRPLIFSRWDLALCSTRGSCDVKESTISPGKAINPCYPQENHFHGNSHTKPTQHSNRINHELHLLDGVEFCTRIVNYENNKILFKQIFP